MARLKPLLFVAAGLLLAAANVGAEEIYKWIDDQGHTHFGSRPPAGTKTTKMAPTASTPDPAAPAATPNWQEQLGLASERRRQQQKKEAEAAKKDQQLAQNCLSAQRALDTLNRERPLYRVNAQGEREYMDDAERAATRESVNQRIAAYCRN